MYATLESIAATLHSLNEALLPTHAVAAFDTKRSSSLRRKLFPQYKATRKQAPEDLVRGIPLAVELFRASNIKSVRKDGYEADDIIASLIKLKPRNCLAFIVSNDKDLYQLVRQDVKLYDVFRRKVLSEHDLESSLEGVSPSQVVDFLSLTGDSSDNVPGVLGIGKKAAKKLLSQYGSLENLLDYLAKSDPQTRAERLVLANRQSALLSKSLIKVNDNVPLEVSFDDLAFHSLGYENMSRLLAHFKEKLR